MKFITFISFLLLLHIYVTTTSYGYCIYNLTPSSPVWYEKYEENYQKIYTRKIQPDDSSCCIWDERYCHFDPSETHWLTGLPKYRSTFVTVKVVCSRWKDNQIFTHVRFQAGGYLHVIKSPTPGEDNYIDVFDADQSKRGWYRCGVKDYFVKY